MELPAYYNDLKKAWQKSVALMCEGVGSNSHGMHTVTIATEANDKPDLRTVVLRSFDELTKTLTFHTDSRSHKVSHIVMNPNVAVLAYSYDEKIQLRMHGQAIVHHQDALTRERFDGVTPSARRCYLSSDAPGTTLDDPTVALAEIFQTDSYDKNDTECAYEHFAVVEVKLTSLDWLYLHHQGHRRARFEFDGETTKQQWLVP